MRRAVTIVGSLAALAAALWFATPPAVGDYQPVLPDFGDAPDAWIENRETQAHSTYGLVAGTEQRIRWQTPGERTAYAVVHLHGFSASRQETAPLADMIADALGANLFETRLTGHGHTSEPMAEVSAEAWMDDAAAALVAGEVLGERLIILSTSTGGTLSLALLDHPLMANVDTLAMISPNVMPADANAKFLTRPGGPLLAKLLVGDTRSWTAHNDQQERYWTTTYPTDAVIEVMRLVDHAASKLPATIEQRVIMIVSRDDKVVSAEAAVDAFEAIDAPAKQLIEIERAGDPSSHVLAGDILSPDSTGDIAAAIVAFVNGSASSAQTPRAPREP